MGCASSSPIVEGGTRLVDGAKDSISKGGKALQDAEKAAEGGLQSGIESVKGTIHTISTNAEQDVENVMGKIGETFNFRKEPETMQETLKEMKTELLHNTSDTAAEAVSQAETVLASETESAKDAFVSRKSAVFETVRSLENETVEIKNDGAEVLEDLEGEVEHGVYMLGDNVNDVCQKMEEEELECSPKEDEEIKKEEEVQPTFWEAAADAILLQRVVKSMDFRDHEKDKKKITQPDLYEVDSEKVPITQVKINQFLTKDNDNV